MTAETALSWVAAVNTVWYDYHWYEIEGTYTGKYDTYIFALNECLSTQESSYILAEDLGGLGIAWTNKFWMEKWHVDYDDFDDNDHEYRYPKDAFKYMVEYVIGSSEADDLDDAYDNTTDALSSDLDAIESVVEYKCADEYDSFCDRYECWTNTITDDPATLKQSYICYTAKYLMAVMDEDDDCDY